MKPDPFFTFIYFFSPLILLFSSEINSINSDFNGFNSKLSTHNVFLLLCPYTLERVRAKFPGSKVIKEINRSFYFSMTEI